MWGVLVFFFLLFSLQGKGVDTVGPWGSFLNHTTIRDDK